MELTIEITTKCEEGCEYCSSNADENNYHILELETIENMMIRSTANTINISGGEPLSHPNIYEILKLAYKHFDEVWIYSNMIKNIRFNSDIIPEGIQVHANTVVREGSINIPPADQIHLLELQQHGRAEGMNKVNFNVSGNNCKDCDHEVLQADGKITKPCQKEVPYIGY